MAQIKIYGIDEKLSNRRSAISEAIHSAVIECLNYPVEKRFHRFIGLAREDFLYPGDRSEDYLIIEISMFEGRTRESKKALIRRLFETIAEATGISTQDIEITLFETPKENWGIRGLPADELRLNYKVEV